MGTRYGFYTQVIGPEPEKSKIEALIAGVEDLSHSLNKWDVHVRNWTPDEGLQTISNRCKETYILLKTAQESSRTYETIFYQGVWMNGYGPSLRQDPSLDSVRQLKEKIDNEKRNKLAGPDLKYLDKLRNLPADETERMKFLKEYREHVLGLSKKNS